MKETNDKRKKERMVRSHGFDDIFKERRNLSEKERTERKKDRQKERTEVEVSDVFCCNL